jgi:hypothetical protein
VHVADEPLEQLEQIVLGPIQILDQEHERPFADQVLDELGPCIVKPVAHSQWVKL